jgi:hypothetical protein
MNSLDIETGKVKNNLICFTLIILCVTIKNV